MAEKHICHREADIGKLEVLTAQHEKALKGNGNEGLVIRFAKLETEHNDIMESVDKLATAFSALAKSDSNREAVRKALGKALVKSSLIIGAAGTIIALILKLTG